MLNEDYKELLGCCESDIAEDCNLFEKALWNANKVCVVPGRPMYFEDEPAETLPDVQEYRLRMMEDMVEYYQCHQVNDDDLDTIQQVMQGGYEQLTQNSFLVPDRAVCGEDCYFRDKVPCELCHAYFAAVDVLDCHHVVFDETTGAVTKSLEEIGDACLRYDIGRRTWCQIGVGSSEYEYIADSVEDNQAGPGEVCEERLLKERLREVLNTLTDRERLIIDFRFGLSDGYSRKLEEVGRLFNVTRERIREIEARALRKLRHPERIRGIADYRVCANCSSYSQILAADLPFNYRGEVLPIGEWARLSHKNLVRLIRHGMSRREICDLLDARVAKVDNEWMYYMSAAKRRGVTRDVAHQLFREHVLAQDIAGPNILYVLGCGDRQFTMDELVELTHLPKWVLKERIDAKWSAERILTERLQPDESAFRQETDIGDVRMTTGEWMLNFQITADDLFPYVRCDGLNVDWNGKTLRAAMFAWLRQETSKRKLNYEYAFDLLSKGWSWQQIITNDFQGMPGNVKSLFVFVSGRRMRLSYFQNAYNLSDDRLQACVRREDGRIRWDVGKGQELLYACARELEQKRVEASKIQWHGLRLMADEWSTVTGIPVSAIKERLSRRWHIDDVFTVPYPCDKLITVVGRHYTEEMFRERFGISYEEHLSRERVETAERKRQAEMRRAELMEMRRREQYESFLKKRLRMADSVFTIQGWLRLLNIPEEALEEQTDLYSFPRSIEWCSRIRGVLRSMARIGSNDQLNLIIKKGGLT